MMSCKALVLVPLILNCHCGTHTFDSLVFFVDEITVSSFCFFPQQFPALFSAAVFGMGATNSNMMGMQQQQQGVYGNMQAGAQNMQQGMVGLQNQGQNPNFPQQRQQNQQQSTANVNLLQHVNNCVHHKIESQSYQYITKVSLVCLSVVAANVAGHALVKSIYKKTRPG